MDVFALLMEFWFDMSEFTELCSLLHVSYSSTLRSSMFIHSLQWTISFILFKALPPPPSRLLADVYYFCQKIDAIRRELFTGSHPWQFTPSSPPIGFTIPQAPSPFPEQVRPQDLCTCCLPYVNIQAFANLISILKCLFQGVSTKIVATGALLSPVFFSFIFSNIVQFTYLICICMFFLT